MIVFFVFFFFKQKTAYEMRISDWSSDVCSSDLEAARIAGCEDTGGQRILIFQTEFGQADQLVALIIAGIALQKEQNVGAAAILLRNLRPVSLKVTARTRKVNDAGRRKIGRAHV